MRTPHPTASIVLLTLSSVSFCSRAQAETFSFTATGYDINTKVSLSVSATLLGTKDKTVAGAYDLTAGSGLITLDTNGAAPSIQSLTLYVPSGSPSNPETVAFSGPPFQYNSQYTYNNVLYTAGTTLNDARGAQLDEYGLLFSTPDNHFNFFGQGAYAYVDDSIMNGFNSPLNAVAITDITSTGVTPEPSSFALLGTGLLGVVTTWGRRRRAA